MYTCIWETKKRSTYNVDLMNANLFSKIAFLLARIEGEFDINADGALPC